MIGHGSCGAAISRRAIRGSDVPRCRNSKRGFLCARPMAQVGAPAFSAKGTDGSGWSLADSLSLRWEVPRVGFLSAQRRERRIHSQQNVRKTLPGRDPHGGRLAREEIRNGSRARADAKNELPAAQRSFAQPPRALTCQERRTDTLNGHQPARPAGQRTARGRLL